MELLLQRIIAEPNAYFCYQEEMDGETPPMLADEKLRIAKELFVQNKSLFLQRYNSFMSAEDCSLFDGDDDFIVKHFLMQIRRRDAIPSTSAQKIEEPVRKVATPAQIKNRRYAALVRLQGEGKYFSNEKMREREPLLFDKMIGRFLDETAQLNLRPTVTRVGGWSRVLEQFEESMEVAARRNEHSTTWDRGSDKNNQDERQSRFFSHVANKLDDQFVPEEEMEDESQEEASSQQKAAKDFGALHNVMKEMMLECDDDDDDTSPEILREEFVAYMEDQFLSGKDAKFFDYSVVDCNEEIDDNDMIKERDLEDKWFDDEEVG